MMSSKNFVDEEDLTIYVFINQNLKLGLGESCAQTAHAVAQMASLMPVACEDTLTEYANNPSRVVVLGADNEGHLQSLLSYCRNTLGIHAEPYIDEGIACKMTAIATQPIPKSLGDEVFGDFQRYGWNAKTKFYPGWAM